MSSVIQIKRRVNGAAGAPAAAGFKEGELALNFPGAAGTTTKPEMWAFDGSGFRRVNPNVTVGSATIALQGTPAVGTNTGIGAGWTALTTKPTEDVVVASYNSGAWMKTGAGGADADWTSLGSAASITYATAAEVLAGTSTTTVINPKILRDYSVVSPNATPTNDANHMVRLNASGKIDPGFISITHINFKGAIAPTATAPATPAAGDWYFVSAAGTAHTSWGLGAGKTLEAQDILIYDGGATATPPGTGWHAIQGDVNLDTYLPLSGTTTGKTMADTAVITFATPTAAATTPTVRIDGGDKTKSSLDNFTIDCGSY